MSSSKEQREAMARRIKIYGAIVQHFPNTKGNRGQRSSMECPTCHAQISLYRDSRKGHLRASCETKHCFSVIE